MARYFEDMRSFLFLALVIQCESVLCQDSIPDPSGMYALENRGFELDSGTFVGPFGSLTVQMVGTDSIAVSLSVNRGWPSYNMGDLDDTTYYDGHSAICHTPEDTTCKLVLRFRDESVELEQNQSDLNSGCGFGHAVIAHGVYRKVHKDRPVEHWWDNSMVDCGEQLKALHGKWSREEMDLLLNSFHPACLNNVEYREWDNELLFQALARDPAMFIAALDRAVEFWQIPFVLHELANPVNDGIAPDQIKEKVRSIQVGNDWLKQKVLDALGGNFY